MEDDREYARRRFQSWDRPPSQVSGKGFEPGFHLITGKSGSHQASEQKPRLVRWEKTGRNEAPADEVHLGTAEPVARGEDRAAWNPCRQHNGHVSGKSREAFDDLLGHVPCPGALHHRTFI